MFRVPSADVSIRKSIDSMDSTASPLDQDAHQEMCNALTKTEESLLSANCILSTTPLNDASTVHMMCSAEISVSSDETYSDLPEVKKELL